MGKGIVAREKHTLLNGEGIMVVLRKVPSELKVPRSIYLAS